MSDGARHFTRRGPALALALVLAAGGAAAQGGGPRERVDRAVEGMGGEAALRALASRSADFRAITFSTGQEEWPEGPRPVSVTEGREVIDWRGGRRMADTRLVGFNAPQRLVTTPTAGMVQRDTLRTPATEAQVAAGARTLRLSPERLLLAARSAEAVLAPLAGRSWRARTLDGVAYRNGPDTLSLWFDRGTGRLAGVESVADDPVFGVRRTFTAYGRWSRVGDAGVFLPTQVDVEVDGQPASTTLYANLRVNAALDEAQLAVPPEVAARPSTRPGVAVAELAPGVLHVTGGSHHSLAVAQGDSVVVVEAPQSPQRTRAVLDAVAERFPRAPVRLVVATHHHVDHVGGLREVFDAGIAVAAPERSARYLAGVGLGGRPAPRPRTVRPVGDSLAVGTGERRMVLYSVPTSHADGMLVAYLPAQRLLFQADLFPGPAELGADLYRFVRTKGLAVDRVAGAHGAVTPWEAFERAVSPR
ncbi:MAG TPA: MBL fold metallo-hydrolase [Longimicrobiaceae bacterium]